MELVGVEGGGRESTREPIFRRRGQPTALSVPGGTATVSMGLRGA